MAVLFSILANEFDINTLLPASSFPHTFATPVPIYIDASFYFDTGSHIDVITTGYITGYDNDVEYPCLEIQRQNSGYGDGYGGFYFHTGSATYDSLESHVQRYDNNGQKTEDYISYGNVDATVWYGGSIPNGDVTVRHCTIPIIFEENHDLLYYAKASRNNFQEFDSWDEISCRDLIDTEYVINTAEEVIPEGDEFSISVGWTTGTWTSDTPPVVTSTYFQGVRGKITSGRLALYRIEGVIDNCLKLGILDDATYYGLEYSDNNTVWHESEDLHYEFFYRKHKNELGTFAYALYVTTKRVPIFGSLGDAEEWINNPDPDAPPTDAENWDDISPYYPPQNPTGDPDEETEFGEVSSRNMFSQLYLCNVAGLYEISNALFDYDVTTLTGLWEDIKKGLEMYGSNPMEVVQGLRYYPCDLSTVFQSVQSQNYIYFGAYQLQMQNNVLKVIYANGYIDLGTVAIKRTYNDWRDFEPYTKLTVYLPYVGMYPLDVKKYYGKNVNIRYFVDLRSGACTACLIADGILIDWFDGVLGTEMPITLTDYSSYAQSQLNIIMRNAGIGIAAEGMAGNVAVKTAKAGISAMPSETAANLTAPEMISMGVGGALGAVGLVGGVAAGTAMKTAFDVMKSGTAAHTKTRPSSSGMINQYLPQYPFFRFEILEIDETPYLNELYGRPANASGLIANFNGYLEAEDIMLICPTATDNERQEIIDLVKAGIYI